MYGQTGDVLFKKISYLPTGLKEMPGSLIHKGENHHHTIEGKFKLHGNGTDVLAIEALSECELKHEEHQTRVLSPGIWEKGIVQEYDHLTEESRAVID